MAFKRRNGSYAATPGSATQDWGNPISRGLVGHWPLSEGGGQYCRDIARGNDGVITGATWVSAQGGHALEFSGISQYVTVTGGIKKTFNNVSSSSGSGFTLSAWIRCNGNQNANTGLVFYRATNIGGLAIANGGAGRNIGYTYLNQGFTWTSGPLAPDKQWALVAMVFPPATSVAGPYIGYVLGPTGFLTASDTNVVTSNNELIDALCIGADPYDYYRCAFNGRMRHVRIWERPVSLRELRRLYLEPDDDILYAPVRRWGRAGTASGSVAAATGSGTAVALSGSIAAATGSGVAAAVSSSGSIAAATGSATATALSGSIAAAIGTNADVALAGSIAAATGTSADVALSGSIAAATGTSADVALSGSVAAATGTSADVALAGSVAQATGTSTDAALAGSIAQATGSATVAAVSSAGTAVGAVVGSSVVVSLSGSIGRAFGDASVLGVVPSAPSVVDHYVHGWPVNADGAVIVRIVP